MAEEEKQSVPDTKLIFTILNADHTPLFITSTATIPQELTLIKNPRSLSSLEIDQDESQIPSMLTA